MKTSKILSLVGGLLLLSMFFGSCKDDQRVAPAPKEKAHIVHLELTANIVKQIDVAGTKGFTLDVNHSNGSQDSKTEAIKWGSDTWSNVDNKPQLIGVLKHTTDGQVTKAWKVPETEYDYNPGHDNTPAQVNIYSNVSITGSDNEYKVMFYLVDKKQETKINGDHRSGTIDFLFGASLYDTTGVNPVFQKNIDENVFIHPNKRIYFNFIFEGEIALNTYHSTGVKSFDMKPLGSLLMVDFSPMEGSGEVNNPAAVDGFTPSLTTNAFGINATMDIATAKNVNATDETYTEVLKFESYDENSNSIYPSTPSIKKINKTTLSDIYVRYVLPRDRVGYKISIVNNGFSIYSNNSTTANFYNLFNTKKVGLNLVVSAGAVMPSDPYTHGIVTQYNALSYVGEYNVALNKESFNLSNNNTNNALVSWEDAKALFTSNKEYLKGYHLPTVKEWSSVVPYNDEYVLFANSHYTNIENTEDGLSIYNEIQIGKAILKNVKSAYMTKEEPIGSDPKVYVTYAIRFISAKLETDEYNNRKVHDNELTEGHCPYLSLWRYAYVDNPNGEGKMMDVYCYVLPQNTLVDYSTNNLRYFDGSQWVEFTNKKFFEDRKDTGAVHRVLPTSGYGDQATNVGSNGYYWSSSTEYKNSKTAYYMSFISSSAYSNVWTRFSTLYAVRPFFGATQQ